MKKENDKRKLIKYYFYTFTSSLLSFALAILSFLIAQWATGYFITLFIILFLGSVFYFTGYKNISLNELPIYPLQFLSLSELQSAETKKSRQYRINFIFVFLIILVICITNFYYHFKPWVEILAYAIALISGYQYNCQRKLNFIRTRIAKLAKHEIN